MIGLLIVLVVISCLVISSIVDTLLALVTWLLVFVCFAGTMFVSCFMFGISSSYSVCMC